MRFISVICVRYAVGLEGKADVSDYTAKHALIDLGFIDGYLHETDSLPRDWCMFETLFDALQRIEEYALEGHLTGCPPTDSSYPRFLHDLGFVRGLIWSHSISSAVSEAISRIIGFATGSDDFPCRLLDGCGDNAESSELRLSDEQRHTAGETAISGKDAHTAEFAASIGATHHGVLDHWRKMGGLTRAEVEEELAMAPSVVQHLPGSTAIEVKLPSASGSIGPEVKSGERHSIPPSRVDEVRTMAETMSDDEIAVNLAVSRDTVLRFRKKHGIEKQPGPREGKTRWQYQWEPWQKQKLIEMKQSGASYGEISKVVGKTPNQCSGIWHWEKKKLEAPVEATPEVIAPTAPHDSPPPPDLSISVHSPADRWKPSPIDVAEWPDIQRMLASGRSREAIAGDYDVPVGDLNDFIADRLQETKERHRANAEVKLPPGEAPALSPFEVGSAA